ncbi:pheromone-regulated protein prm10 [Thecaphora frezii]
MTDSQDTTLNNSSSSEPTSADPTARHMEPSAHQAVPSAAPPAAATTQPDSVRSTSRAGRVHFDGSSEASTWRRDQLQLGHAGGGGPTVTARGGARPEAGLSLGSVQRPNHPGPLNLAERLSPLNEASPPAFQGASAQGAPHSLAAVQGADADAAPHQVPTLSLTGAKGLDEQGLDNRAFLELQRELQKHEARSEDANSAAGDGAPYGIQRHALEQALMEREREREQRRRRQQALAPDTPGMMSTTVSGASTPGGATSESSYDPANDSDLDHIDLVPGETDGMPSRVRKRKDESAEEQPKGWAKLRSIFGKPADEDELDSNEKGEKAGPIPHEEGGPTNWKSVPVETSSGLHTSDGPRRKPSKFEREAARLVKQHKLSQMRSSALDRIGRSHLGGSGDTTPDPQETSMQMDARPVMTGGVLGNLLRLYEQQQREQMASGRSAATSSVGSESEYLIDAHADAAGQSHRDVRTEERQPEASSPLLHPSSLLGPNRDRTDSAAPSIAGARTGTRRGWTTHGLPSPGIGQTFANVGGKVGSTVINTSSKVVKGVASEAGFDDVMDERPKAARSGAGVFGGLIATTGNLIGAVSPAHAQLGPNPKRPGFTLDRYLLPEMNAKTLKRTAQIVADAAPRPYRASGFSSPNDTRSHSVPGSPPAVGFGGERTDSGSTQAGTPPPGTGTHTPKKRPASIMIFPSRSKTNDSNNAQSVHSATHRRLHLPVPGAFGKSWTGHSAVNTPEFSGGPHGDYFGEDAEKLHRQEWQRKLKKRAKDKRRKEEIFITMHVAAILQRQEFLLKLSRALMMFGAPTHRIETQIQQTARVLEVNCRCIYLPNLMLLAFGDDTTHTSETKFIKQGGSLDLTKLTDMHSIYWNVIHDKIGVGEASAQLDELMRRKPLIGRWPMVIIGGFASFFITLGTAGFGGSFIDAVAAFPLGMFLVYCQSIITTELYSNVFEIVFATLNSFIAAALQHSGIFCYSAVVSGSIVLILPGFIVLSGSLELQAKNLIAGSVRMVYAIIYSLFLGFGLSIGVSIWNLFRGVSDSGQQYDSCRHPTDREWWRKDVPEIYALLTTPGYSIALSLRNQVKVNRKEFPVMVLIACAGWASNHFSAKSPALAGRQDITAALGSLVVGLLANLYGRIFDGRSFVVAVPGILYQLPSGLSNNGSGGLLGFAGSDDANNSYSTSGFSVASSLVETALGLTVGLFTSTVISYIFGGRKVRNGGGLFSF